jgi:Zn-dependent protease
VSNKRQGKKNGWWILGAGALFVLGKLKTLLPLLKLGKFGGAILSMAASVWFYALVAPFELAVGLVLMILIHELGHVLAAKQKGLPVSAPVFIPFLGALIMMKRHPRDAVTEAYMAYGGPLLGTIGATLCLWIGWQWDIQIMIVIANVGFFLNFINLIPVHPLDGGRISVAVTRWLWVVGLFGGPVLIYYLDLSFLFIIIWLMFAWDLYKKYVKSKKQRQRYTLSGKAEVTLEQFYESGFPVPGEDHRRELAFTTYSDLDGGQYVEVRWEGIGLKERKALPDQGIIHKAVVTRVTQIPEGQPDRLEFTYVIEYEPFVNDRYYEVPAGTRWRFGAAYLGLALWLVWMMTLVQGLLDPGMTL